MYKNVSSLVYALSSSLSLTVKGNQMKQTYKSHKYYYRILEVIKYDSSKSYSIQFCPRDLLSFIGRITHLSPLSMWRKLSEKSTLQEAIRRLEEQVADDDRSRAAQVKKVRRVV